MKKLLVPMAAFALFAMTGLASAAETTGAIKSMDAKAHTVTLVDGAVFHLPASFDMSKLKDGEKVHVMYETKDGKHNASAVTAAK